MSPRPRHLLRKALASWLVAWMAFSPLGAARAASTDLADSPTFATKKAPPNLMLDLSVEWPTGVVAGYNDNYVDPATPGNTGYGCAGRDSNKYGVCYFDSRTYLGYFDPMKCYDYVGTPGTSSTAPSAGGYFTPAAAGSGTYGHQCTNKWSGNFLNWATMQAIDEFRWTMTGGDRWVDTATQTIIEKARHSGQGGYDQFPIKRLSSSNYSGNGQNDKAPAPSGSPSVTVPGVSPSTVAVLPTSSSTLHARVHDGSVSGNGNPPTGPFFINFYNSTWNGPQLQVDCNDSFSGSCLRTYYARVEVCKSGMLEGNCWQYGSSWKPTGLIQQNADRMRFGVFGYLLDSDPGRAGGVMRAKMKDIGPTMVNSGTPGTANARREFSAADGTYVANPDTSDASASGVSQSGVINYLNKFGKASTGFKRIDPISELYYESLRYIKNMGSATPQYVTSVTSAMRDGFPVITTWDDPVQYSCQKNYAVMIADVNANCDYALPGSTLSDPGGTRCTGGTTHPTGVSNAPSGLNVSTSTKKVSDFESILGYANLQSQFTPLNAPPAPYDDLRKNTWYLAGLAYWANTTDLRPDKTAGTQDRVTVQAYMVDVAESASWYVNGAGSQAINQMWLAAKYGGFDDINKDGVPANQATWDENGDGIPDNYFLASRPDLMAKSLSDVFASVLAKDGAAAAVAVSNANVTSVDRASFSTNFNLSNWTGDLESFQIDLVTGLPVLPRTWSAKVLLDAVANPNANRRIVTHKGTGALGPTNNGIPFRAASLLTAQLTALATPSVTPSDAADVVAFLRGDRSKEGSKYRVRASLMPDFVNAEPVFVGPPSRQFGDNGYSAFASSKSARTKMVYQGGNGGMLHAFNAGTGKEEWAYVPNLVMGSLNNLTGKQALHRYYIDGTPLAADVDFSNTASGSGGADWRTILVGSLGKGGRGYYALDITDPIPADENAAAAKVLWEFPNSSITAANATNLGFSFGRPIIVKTKAKGWVVIVTSGHNNGTDPGSSGGDGQGHIYVLDARNGDLLKDIATGVGTGVDPSGLAKVSAFVEASDVDNTIKYLYGGDLKGNLWRVDFTGNNVSSWDIRKLATLVDGSGNFQPITTEPELGEVNDKPVVIVGTGRYLGDSDVPGTASANFHATQTQTMYGILDNLAASPVVDPLRSQLVQQTFTVGTGQSRTLTSNAVNYTDPTTRGWYVDLPDTGERSNTDPALALGVLSFTTNVPINDVCVPGGKSFFYNIDFQTGGKLTFAGAPPISGTFLGNALASRPTIIKLPNGTVRAIIRMSDKSNVAPEIPVPPSSGSAKRINWKEIVEK